MNNEQPHNRYICPITREIMEDPVMDQAGHNFEKQSIIRWLRNNQVCPLGREPLDISKLSPNLSLREEISEWKRRNSRNSNNNNDATRQAPQPIFVQQQQPQQQLQQLQQQQQQQVYRPPLPPSTPIANDPNRPWNFYRISQEEYDHIMATFMTFDTDGSGGLDRDELQRMCKWLNYPHSDFDIDAMFAAVDFDHSGTLELHEFVVYMQDHRPKPEIEYNLSQDEYQAILMQFHHYDADGSGELDIQELGHLCREMHYPHSRRDLDRMFSAIDTDGNGSISLHEFLTYMKSHNPKVPISTVYDGPRISNNYSSPEIQNKSPYYADTNQQYAYQPMNVAHSGMQYQSPPPHSFPPLQQYQPYQQPQYQYHQQYYNQPHNLNYYPSGTSF